MWSESAFVTAGGLALGAVIAAAISDMLVKVLTGVFDPPPDALSVPWGYLAARDRPGLRQRRGSGRR